MQLQHNCVNKHAGLTRQSRVSDPPTLRFTRNS